MWKDYRRFFMKIKDLPKLCIKEEVSINEDGTFEAKFTLADDVHEDDRELILTEDQCHMILNNLTTILGTIIGGIDEER